MLCPGTHDVPGRQLAGWAWGTGARSGLRRSIWKTVERSKVVNVVWPDATSKEENKRGPRTDP